MATKTFYGGVTETNSLYGNNPADKSTYFEWLIFKDALGQPATPTGGSWSFDTNTGTAPTGWLNSPPSSVSNLLWVSVAVVDSRNPTTLNWSSPGLMASPSGGASGVAISASNSLQNNGTASFANSNGVTFGLSNGVMTATVATNYMGSNQSSNFVNTSQSSLFQQTSNTSNITSNAFAASATTKFAGTGTTFAGTNATATIGLNSNGLAMSLSAAAGGGGGGGAAIQGSGTYTQNTGTVQFANSNNVTFGLSNNGVMTASVSQSADTNKVNTGYTSTTQAGSTVGVTHASNGLSVAWPPFITAGGGGGGIAAAAGTQTAATGTVNFVNSNGITFGMSNSSQITASYTVPTQSVQTQASGNIAGAGYTSTTQAGSTVGATHNSVGLSMAWPPYITTYASQTVQTQASGNIVGAGFTSTTTAGVNVVATHNSAGLSMAVPAYITTYAAQTNQTQASGNIAGVGTTFAGTNVSATMGLNSNGLALSLSAPAGGGGGTTNILQTGPNIADGAGNTVTGGTVVFSNTNGVSFGLSTNALGVHTMTASAAGGGGGGATLSYMYLPDADMITNLSAHANGTMSIQNRQARINYTATQLMFPVNISSVSTTANNSSAGINFSISFVIYTENANTLNSLSSTTFAQGATWTSNATASVTGGVLLTTPFDMNMTPGEYYFGVNMSTAATGGVLTGAATTSLGNTISVMGLATANFGAMSWHALGAGTTQSSGWEEQGLYTGTTAITGPINLANVSMAGTAAQRANFAMQFRA